MAQPRIGNHIVVDVEIQKRIGEDGLGWNDTDKLGISCAVIYDYAIDRFRVYGDDEEDRQLLIQRIELADRVTGYNHWKFDFPVIRQMPGKWRAEDWKPKTDDLLCRIWRAMGLDPFSFSKQHGGTGLGVVAEATLGPGKILSGELAPVLYQEGKHGRLINYCVDDVALTRDLCDFIEKYGYVIHPRMGKLEVDRDWRL